MATNTLKTRIKHKNGSPSDWSQATNFVPLKGELIIYNDATAPKIKVGDGSTLVENLPFVGASITMNGAIASSPSFYAPTGAGTAGQVLKSNGSGAPSWTGLTSLLKEKDKANIWMIYDRDEVGISPNFDDPGFNGLFELRSKSETTGETGTKPYDGFGPFISIKGSNTMFQLAGTNTSGFYIRGKQAGNVTLSGCAWQQILTDGNWSNYITTSSLGALPITGGTMTGCIKSSTDTFLRVIGNDSASYGLMFRKDSSDFYILLTNKDDVNGHWNSHRPFILNLATGKCTIDGNAATATKLATARTISLTGSVTGSGSFDGSGNLSIATTTNHTHSYLPLSGGSMTGNITFNGHKIQMNGAGAQYFYVGTDCSPTVGGALANIVLDSWYGISFTTSCDSTYKGKTAIGFDCRTGTIKAANVYGAVWNDYAEFRSQNETIEPGYIAYCDDDGKLKKTVERLQKYEGVVSDTFGFAIGETDDCKTPLAVSGRALVYCDPEEEHFHSGDCVCAGPDGLAYRMTREEIIEFPDRIVGVVSEIPTYETWGTGNVEVNGRIWIKVK